ncbi:MAG: phosphoribosylformylglycinamidine cyclo-ligase [Deltaproteobacteria bacterium]|nr:phosphoribosylformylglycinamidine cyclo-ligase [Deltaproteobacteria bacterium]MCL5278231.1 phosphoribosylformylglycinamidine cyclo-ligase [Deltaproteobacteria bacterium]
MKYSDAGVSIDAGNAFVEMIKPAARSTMRKGVLAGIGGFAGLFEIDRKRHRRPVVVVSTDGVGTKLRIAFMMDVHDTVGIDLVAMNVNDVVVTGAEPVAFLDYIATSKLRLDTARDIIKGIVSGCRQAGCALLGGETAEMPGFYRADEYDLAGFVVGVVDKQKRLTGKDVQQGDVLIGVGSSGLHSNGYSLARHVLLEKKRMRLSAYIDEFKCTLGEELLKPTIIYVNTALALIGQGMVKAAAHITGGGITENLPRVFPDRYTAVIETGSWNIPPVFEMIRGLGGIDQTEMLRTFNNGIGMIVVAGKDRVGRVMDAIRAQRKKAYVIGEIRLRGARGRSVEFV